MTLPPPILRLPPEGTIDIHPAAKLYPLGALEPLRESIRRVGQQKPGILHQGQLLDGRRRLRVTRLLKIDFLYTEVEELGGLSALEYVLAANQARNLTPSQRALVAARARPAFTAAREVPAATASSSDASSPPVKGKTRDLLGQLFEVDGKMVDAVTAVVEQGHRELVRAVHQGALGVSAARKFLKLSAEEQQQAAAAALAGDKKTLRELRRPARQSSTNSHRRVASSSEAVVNKVEDAVRALEQLLVAKPESKTSEFAEFLSLAQRILAKLVEPDASPGAALTDATEIEVVDHIWARKA